MARETVVSNFKLKGREILSSYAAYTLEGVMTARVKRGRDTWTIEEKNGIAKGTSDGENEAIYIPNNRAIGQAFPGFQLNRFQTALAEHLPTGHSLSRIHRLPQPHQDQCQMGQRCQVPAGTHGTFFRNYRTNAPV